MLKNLLIITTAVVALQGCVISIDEDDFNSRSSHSEHDREERNRDYIADLSVDASIERVKTRLGTPDFSELVVKGEQEYRVLYYRTQWMKGDGTTTKDECTPLVFKNGALVGYGETALDHLS